ncbi:MAG TPA: inositol monophosphatase family protein, partial [Micromonosporaceae bacterium]
MTDDELLALALRVTEEGAELAVRHRAAFLTDVRTKSSDTDVVTAADDAVDRHIIDELRSARPDDRFLSEETGVDPGSGGRVRWILDPIDGTVNYLYGLPYYAVSLAAEVDGEVIAAVVRNAATGDVWTAVRGRGAYWGDRRLRGGTETDLALSLVATGFGYDAARRAHQGAVVAGLMARIRDIRRFGAGALDLCLAASGLVDAYYEKGLNEWDWAAGKLVATEAGLIVSGLRGEPSTTSFLLAAAPAIHGPLHDLLVELDADG